MSAAQRDRLIAMAKRLREAPRLAEEAIKADPSIGEPSPYPFMHGWLKGTVESVAIELQAMLDETEDV